MYTIYMPIGTMPRKAQRPSLKVRRLFRWVCQTQDPTPEHRYWEIMEQPSSLMANSPMRTALIAASMPLRVAADLPASNCICRKSRMSWVEAKKGSVWSPCEDPPSIGVGCPS
ncbi:unnamed protein product [Arctogadus glacialis]